MKLAAIKTYEFVSDFDRPTRYEDINSAQKELVLVVNYEESSQESAKVYRLKDLLNNKFFWWYTSWSSLEIM